MQITQNSVGTMSVSASGYSKHLTVLDGWRGLSILFVLAAHLLPLGAKSWQLNYSIGILGMVLFFNLSGFLITSFLLKQQDVASFLIRRFCRVIPLAWLYLLIALGVSHVPLGTWIAHFFFYANLPPQDLIGLTEHLWSLCVETQFYVAVALLVLLLRKRGLLLLPFIAVFFTGLRISDSVQASSVTYYRIDEIFAGCTLALIYHGQWGDRMKYWLGRLPQWPLLVLLILSCMPQAHWLNYCRPYLAAALIGVTVLNPGTFLVAQLNRKSLAYLAGISYALYVIHPLLSKSWLGGTNVLEKYSREPMLFIILFGLAHVSTHYYERFFMDWSRTVTQNFRKPAA